MKTMLIGLSMILSFGLMTLTDIPGVHAGTIKGVVKFSGDKAPSPKMLKINKDPEVCGEGPRPSDALLISKKNLGVKNAVVSLTDIKTNKKPMVSKEKLTFTQKKCAFSPRVLVIPTETEFKILNNDPLTHNVHTFGKENATINRGQPKTVPVMTHSFEVPERIKVKCDIHKWMNAWFIVVDHPYTVITTTNGNFRMTDVPPGTYTIGVWHEKLGPQTQKVTVKGDEDVSVIFELKEKKRRKRR